ncbi:MAG TPA: MmcQ/YjbR family DNA-binding protein [Candidatus Dormibacteraeota bacterium]|nr:MmcQ/YjbR family DNA-binding protein [Candidatus Dormibacteraeota bacterium]
MVSLQDVRRFAVTLPLTTEALVGGRVKFRVGRIVWLSFSRDESVMGFAFPKEERDWLVGGSPDKFMQPSRSDLRYHWVLVRLAAIDEVEMRELVLDAWRMVVPKRVAATYDGAPLMPIPGPAPRPGRAPKGVPRVRHHD